jgi:Na+-exporting ATPase
MGSRRESYVPHMDPDAPPPAPPKHAKKDVPEGHVSGQSNMRLSKPAHALSHEELVDELQANTVDGLSTDEAKQRLEKYGPNMFQDARGVKPWDILVRQVANAMMLVR